MSALENTILKDVSRSFYLSMRVLPHAMREPISLGYLLARASDTLADTDALAPGLRLEMLDGMEDLLSGADRGGWLDRLEAKVIPQQTHLGEKVLLEQMAAVFDWLDRLDKPGDSEVRQAIIRVMGHIIEGQRLDIERFELQSGYRMEDEATLERYCYLVAGCVGEFWTEIGTLTTRRFSSADPEQLMAWGRHYGQALQLINILRDLPEDLQVGRCYLPGVEVADQRSLLDASGRWRSQAREWLKEGENYALSLRARRLRMATALPGMIGELTLDRMEQADWETLSRGVKVTRREVYHCLWQAWIL